MKKSLRLGFSLIELSVVILVIGILVLGIVQGSRIISRARLASAQSLTQNSPVASTADLVLWLETTSNNSFADSEEIDTAITGTGTITSWNDINPHTTSPKNATQSGSATLRPKYIAKGINGLPVLGFDGSSDYLNLPDGTVPYGNSPYSVFLVSMPNSLCTCGILGSGTYGVNNKSNAFRYSSTGALYNYWWNVDIFAPAGTAVVKATNIFNTNYNQSTRTIYVNGVLKAGPSAASNRDSTDLNNTVGVTHGTEYLNGYIAEIIVFNRALNNYERTGIESYLKSKWGIN